MIYTFNNNFGMLSQLDNSYIDCFVNYVFGMDIGKNQINNDGKKLEI